MFLGLVIGLAAAWFIYSQATRKSPDVKGKVILITGGSAGIGEEVALKYAKLGARIVLAARDPVKLENTLAKVKALGAEAITVPTDVANEEQSKAMVKATIDKFGKIDMLVLNAGIGCLIRVADLTDLSPYKKVMDINYWGYVYPAFAALPFLRKTSGTIVVISSLSALFPTPRRAGYSASKKAVHGFFECLRQEESNIQVSIVCPGFVMTELHDRALTAKGPLERTPNSFMTATKCADIILDAVANGERLHVMTTMGKVGYYLTPFFSPLLDKIAKSKAEASVIEKKDN